MKKLIDWLKESNRWKHLAGGFLIGLFANGIYCAAYSSILAAVCLEYKDRAHGGKWDWIDFGLTVGGAAVGYGIRMVVGLR